PEHAAAISFDVALQGYDEAKGRAFYKRVVEQARALPSVTSAALTESLPLSIDYNSTAIYIEGQAPKSSSDLPSAVPRDVGPEYFRTMQIPLRGRDFLPNENKTESRVAVVSETFARRFFPGEEAIGKRFNFSGPSDPYWQIIGVCGDGKYNSLGEETKPAVYRPLLRDYTTPVTLVARAPGSATTLLASIKNETQKLDPKLTIFVAKTLEEHMEIPLFPARMAADALGSFGVLALVLAAIGIYGVMSYVVAGRTREIGLRMALGAQAGNIRGLILRQGMLLAAIGGGIGLIVSVGATRLLDAVLYGVSAVDPVTFVFVTALLGTIALLACWFPARRATRVDPMVALRSE
ncbi:MAG: FtsX-like permease family protein, partial [Rhodanobacteraceae bacterium]